SSIRRPGISHAPNVVEIQGFRSLEPHTARFRPWATSRRIGQRIDRCEPNKLRIKLRKSLDDSRRSITVGQHVRNLVYRNARTFEDGRSAQHARSTGY